MVCSCPWSGFNSWPGQHHSFTESSGASATWDVAAASLLVEEARGRVTKVHGSPLDLAGGQIVSRSKNLHGKILRGTAVTRLRRHDDILVEDAAAAREIACP
jgi:3'-phosphoadenosine 5'-phosphosulfate (PAPS) 3'-phosphatase